MLVAGRVHEKPDGTKVHTLWGELAWQLGGSGWLRARCRIRPSGTSPGSALIDLFDAHTPCLDPDRRVGRLCPPALRHRRPPGGSFDAQFTFAQALAEAAKRGRRRTVRRRIPASDIEVGGEGGEAALERLKNVVGRMESPWRPASRRRGLRDRPPPAVRGPPGGRGARPRRRRARVRATSTAPGGRVPVGVPRGRLRAAHRGRLPDPSRAVRPPLQRVVDARQVPAHPRRAASDGGGDPRAVGAQRREPADHAGVGSDRRPAGRSPS